MCGNAYTRALRTTYHVVFLLTGLAFLALFAALSGLIPRPEEPLVPRHSPWRWQGVRR